MFSTLLSKSPKKTASDLYNISNQLIYFINPSVCETFAKLNNRCFVEGYFTKTLKIANVLPLYKSDSGNEFGSYRPI